MLFADQVGIRSDQVTGRTWGENGRAPIVRRTGNRFCGKAMSAISTKGRMHFMVFAETFDAKVMCRFLDRLIGHFDCKIHVVVDGHSAHRSRMVRTWLADHADRIELHFLPSYSPELNPDELVNADLKRSLRWEAETRIDQIKTQLRGPGRVLRSRTPELAYQEIWAHPLTHWAVSALICSATTSTGTDPDRIKFLGTLRSVRRSLTDRTALALSPTQHSCKRCWGASHTPATTTPNAATAATRAQSSANTTTTTPNDEARPEAPTTADRPPSRRPPSRRPHRQTQDRQPPKRH